MSGWARAVLTAILLGFGLGLRHAFDPDHVVAISTIVARHRSPWVSSWVGACWGMGHSATLFAVGFLVIALRVAIPDGFTQTMELLVGACLVALGVANLLTVRWRDDAPRSRRPHGRGPSLRAALTRAGAIGLLHGLAGSAAVALLALAAMPSALDALAFLCVFALGTVAGMVACSLALGAPAAIFGGAERFRRLATAATGLLSLLVGCALIARVGGAGGLRILA